MTKQQIKEALDAVADYCKNRDGCSNCDLRDDDDDLCFFDVCTPSTMKTEKIAEVVADETD